MNTARTTGATQVTQTTTTTTRAARDRGRSRSSSSSSSSSSSDDGQRRPHHSGNAQDELDALRQRGLYRGPGATTAERIQVVEAQQYVKEDAPVIEEHVHKRAVHEVVPTVRREREVAEIRHAVLPIRQQVREDRTYSERQLGEVREREYRQGITEEERRKNRAISERLSRGFHEELPTEHEYVYAKPQVEEVVRPRIIHEIHPVVQREVDRQHYERQHLAIRERVIDGPRVSGDVEVLKPLSFEEWAATHGRAIYEQSVGGSTSGLRQDLPLSSGMGASRREAGYSSHRVSRRSIAGAPMSSLSSTHYVSQPPRAAPIASYDAHYGPCGHSAGLGPRISHSNRHQRRGASPSSSSSSSSSSESDHEYYDDRHRYRAYRQTIAPTVAGSLPPSTSRRRDRRHF